MKVQWLARYSLCAALFVLCANAWALTPAEIDQSNQEAKRQQQLEQQRQQEQFERDRSSASPPTVLPVPQVPVPTGEEGACRDIKTIHVGGSKLLSSSAMDAITSRYVNRCLGVKEIETLLADITRAYVQKGYITVRAYLPQQDLSQGHLEILVVEGKVSRIDVDDGGKHSISLGNVAPYTQGKPLNLRDFEQALDQINRLSSNNATVEMLPGEEPGDTVVVLHNKPRAPWHLNLSLDNQGSDSTGKTQAGVTFSLDNPLRMNDFVSYTHRETLPAQSGSRLSISNSLSYVLPLGYNTLNVSLSKSRYESLIITGAGTTLHNSGNSRNNTVRLDRVIFRDASSRWNVYGGITAKDSESFLETTLLAGASRKLTVMDVGVSLSTVVLGGAITLDVGASHGLHAFNALYDADSLLSSDPRAQFHKWVFSGSYQRPFSIGGQEFQFSSQWSGQHSNDVLYGSEQILIGGIYTVRGFDNTTISGDHGFYIRNEIGLRKPFSIANLSGSVRPWIGLDYGTARNRNPGVQEGELTGLALGIQTNIGSAVSLDLFGSKPLSMPSGLTREPAAIWARMSINL